MAGQATDGIDAAGVEEWFRGNVADAEPPLDFERISGGRSNLTYSVTDSAGRRWALRRPPLGKRLASAHDMGREYTIISALRDTPVPVANAVGLCGDEAVNGAPFYVMDWVEGPILRSKAEAELFPDEHERRAIGERVVDTLIAIHSVNPDQAGLGELAKKEDYVARQLHRWQGQWERSRTRELPLIDEVHDRLAARIPDQGAAAIVHGDYRIDNMILTPGGEVAAVVDWELCTLGDPLADVGLLLVYWGEEDDELSPLLEPAFRTVPRSAICTPSARAATSHRSTSTSPSASGSSRSSSRGSSPATAPASTATPRRLARATSSSSSWSRPRRPSSGFPDTFVA